ncbi:NHL repeat-containing protein [Neotamlana laminarinivorans]|uniref:Prolow-density lipoprotein receptor-related protein 1-like beta-propeller domain-containing protein n=1 Tax=Neotamlana laminarinivorans TaxID=2883124 RepID=A0A9X1L4T7_9FLAO|nr:hypothetical protein [Tamlana laminarinivorans]MCB4798641.1 hypothetical protein [Tamlana laminarinivorans]
MNFLKVSFLAIVLCFCMVSCNKNQPEYDITSEPSTPVEYKWWILTHKNYQKPGIYLYDEETGLIELEISLPDDLQSPHALAFDGEYLWVGGNGENESMYQINPETGEVVNTITNIITEGIAIKDDYIYYSNLNTINIITKNGNFVDAIETENTALNISDIAISESNLYYLRYSETEPVVKLNLDSFSETPITGLTTSGTYCLAYFDYELITISALNEINHNSIQTGEILSSTPTVFEGWITAITPHIITEN